MVLALAGVCPAGAAPATTRPARGAEVTAAAAAPPSAPPSAPAPQSARDNAAARVDAPPAARPPATRPAPGAAPVRSEVGQALIRRDAAAAPSTRPASPASAVEPAVPPATTTLEVSKVAGALAIVLTLIFALKLVMKRAFGVAGAVGSSRSVVVLSRTVLAPKQQVMLLHVGRRLIVVGDSGGQMSTLSEITDPDEVAALVGQLRDEKLSSAGPAFGGLLGRLRAGMDGGGSSSDTNAQERTPTRNNDDRPDGDDDRGFADDPATGSTRQEINGLLAKVRQISHQFKGT